MTNRFAMKNQIHRKDATHYPIILRIEKEWPEAYITDLSMVGGGCPDMFLWLPVHRRGVWIEAKTAERPELTEAEREWHLAHKDLPIITPRTPDEAMALIRTELRRKQR